MAASSFTRSFLLLFSGPIIWAVHFLTIYGFTGVRCARPALRQEWLGTDITAWGIGIAAAVAIAVIVAVHWRCWHTSKRSDGAYFTRWMASALGILSITAIIWETVPVLLVPGCL